MGAEVRRTKCAGCDFWFGFDDLAGQCRRHPPVIVDALVASELAEPGGCDSPVELSTRFPITAHDQSCGEHRPIGAWPVL